MSSGNRSSVRPTFRPCGRVLVAALLAGVAPAGCGGGNAPPAATPAPPAVCGDGQVERGEECDDGNADNADACLATCQKPVTWVASEPHVHSSGCGILGAPEDLDRLLREQSIQVVAALVWRDGFAFDAPFFTGHDHPLSRPGFILHYDLEVSGFPAGDAGHLLLLGLDSLGFSDDIYRTPHSGVPIVEWARSQPRAVVGMAHGQFWPSGERFPSPPVVCCMPWELAVHAARGRLDFMGMERLPADQGPVDDGTFRLWRSLENSGFRVAITGASDYPCITHAFSDRTPRTDVIVEGDLTYERWLQSLKAGRTACAIGIGTRLNLRVNGARLGEELRLAGPQEVTATLETVMPLSGDVAVLVNGRPAASVRIEAGVQLAQVRLPIAGSSWIAAQSPYGLTSPVYVLVEGRAIRGSADDTCYLMRYVDHLEHLVTSRQLDLAESRDEALAAYDEALAELARRFTEAGGQSCS